MAANTQTETPFEIEIRDVEYQRQSDHSSLARVYQPRGNGPFPSLVDVHGGAWQAGDRLNNAVIDEALAKSGILVVALDFRQSQHAPYPASLNDINLGIRWLKLHAEQFRGQRQVGGLGTSSGGHQIMLTALRPTDPRYTSLQLSVGDGVDASLAYVVACWPVLDPLARYENALEKRPELASASEAYFKTREAMTEGNPQLILDRGEQMALPPALIVQGTQDENVSPAMQERFVATYRKTGGTIDLRAYEGMPHAFITKQPDAPESAAALKAIASFIRDRAS